MVAGIAALATSLHAQAFAFRPQLQPEWRVDVSTARRTSAVLMAGANIPLGYYVRAGAALGVGAVDAPHGAQGAARADVTLRFLLDPFAQNTWGPYAGGGLTVRQHASEAAAVGVLVVIGVEGKFGRRWTPAAEFALGEGARFAFVLRKTRTNGR